MPECTAAPMRLKVPETGTTVRLRDGKARVQDGPYADTKEQLAGFIILEGEGKKQKNLVVI